MHRFSSDNPLATCPDDKIVPRIIYSAYQKGRLRLTAESTSLTAGRIVSDLRKCGITHLIWLPDAESQIVCEALIGQPDFILVPVCREGEAIAVAVGLMLGGGAAVHLWLAKVISRCYL